MDILVKAIASLGAGNTTVVARTAISHLVKNDENVMPR